jgi:16S rRNA (cytosine1402-N4)-methyltransferase
MDFHVPVMVKQVVEGLATDPEGVYLDATAGGGGHSQALLEVLGEGGRLIALDRDPEAIQAVRERLGQDERVEVWQGCFAELETLLRQHGVEKLQGVLFDLGLSSHQIDEPGRGFSYRQDGPLDMRMDPTGGPTAEELIAQASEAELGRLIRECGEERQARQIARSICQWRRQQPLRRTADLRQAVLATRPQMPNKTLARVFQALRMAVNGELRQLEAGLDAACAALAPGGRLAVIAYHSLEDRLVKARLAPLMRGCRCPPRAPLCTCGGKPTFSKVLSRPRRPEAAEVQNNSRARSARLRLYERIEVN